MMVKRLSRIREKTCLFSFIQAYTPRVHHMAMVAVRWYSFGMAALIRGWDSAQ
jgi:hypothetical protein